MSSSEPMLSGTKPASVEKVSMSTEIAEKVKDIISQQLDVEKGKIQETASFVDDLGADSLAIVELVLAFEEQFEIDIPDEDTEKIRTVNDAVKYIASHVKK